jgi:hypothetical protein
MGTVAGDQQDKWVRGKQQSLISDIAKITGYMHGINMKFIFFCHSLSLPERTECNFSFDAKKGSSFKPPMSVVLGWEIFTTIL